MATQTAAAAAGGGGGEQTQPQPQPQPQQTQQLVTVLENEATVKSKTIKTKQFGNVHVHIQGDLPDSAEGVQKMQNKAIFLTVHDIGSNHSSMRDFVDTDSMTEIRNRSVFIHVDVCGQEDNADDYNDNEFPTILQIGEEVIADVLDSLHVPLVVGLGEGAGANILARFGLAHPSRVLGLILIHLVSTEVGFLETLKDRFFHRRNSQQMSTIDIVAMHKMGAHVGGAGGAGASAVTSTAADDNSRQLLDAYKQRVQTLNAKNLRKYVSAYMNRKEIHDLHELDVLLVTGQKSLYCNGVESIYSKCNKTKTSLLKIDLCTDVISECPEKLAQSLLLFVKGLGFLTSCPQTDGSRESSAASLKSSLGSIGRRRTLSMEEYDVPRIRRLSLTK